jgi:cytochrome c oxidase subunit 3
MEIPYTFTARPDTGLYNGKLGIWLFLASEVMLFGAIFTAYLFMRLGADDGTWPDHIQNVGIGFTNTCLLICSSITMVWAWVALKERKFGTYKLALFLTILCGLAFLGLKAVEYYSKFHHTGVIIKEDAFRQKYMDELQKNETFFTYIRSQQAYVVRGHNEVAEGDKDTLVLLPDPKPKYLYNFEEKKTAAAKEAASATTGNEATPGTEEKTIKIAKSDIIRSGLLLPAYGTYYAIYFLVTGLHALHIVGGVVVMSYFFFMGQFLYRRNPEQLSNRIEVTGIFWHFVDLVWITVFPILYLT